MGVGAGCGQRFTVRGAVSLGAGQEGAAAQYRHLLGTGRAISELPAIVMAAYEGRIDTLFVAVGEQRWG